MNVKKLAASLMMLSLCALGVENIGAAAPAPADGAAAPAPADGAAAPAPADGAAHLRIAQGIILGGADGITPIKVADRTPVLVPKSAEEKLFKAFQKKGILLLAQKDVSAGGVRGLQKYLRRLIDKGITADIVDNPNIPPAAVRMSLQTNMAEVTGLYHNAATRKAENVRRVVSSASICIRAIAQATRDVVLAGDTDAIIAAFNNALAGPGNELARMISENFAGGRGAEHATGASGTILEDNRQAILELQGALAALVRLSMNKMNSLVASSASMQLFHEIYKILCISHCGGPVFFEGYTTLDGTRKSAYNDFDPPSPENGNKLFYLRYQEWLHENGLNEPRNGMTLSDIAG